MLLASFHPALANQPQDANAIGAKIAGWEHDPGHHSRYRLNPSSLESATNDWLYRGCEGRSLKTALVLLGYLLSSPDFVQVSVTWEDV